MNWGEYKALCDRPDYWSAWMANQCIQLLHGSDLAGAQEASAVLHQDLCQPALARPVGHKGNADTWMYRVSLSAAQCEILLEAIGLAQAQGQRTIGTQTRGLGGFAEHCQELQRLRRVAKSADLNHV